MHRLLIIALSCGIICTALTSCSKTSIKTEPINELPITNIVRPIDPTLGFFSFKAKDTFTYTSIGNNSGSFMGGIENKPGQNFLPLYVKYGSSYTEVEFANVKDNQTIKKIYGNNAVVERLIINNNITIIIKYVIDNKNRMCLYVYNSANASANAFISIDGNQADLSLNTEQQNLLRQMFISFKFEE